MSNLRIDYKNGKKTKECLEADYFARALLMPEMTFRNWWRKCMYLVRNGWNEDIFSSMAKVFGVERKLVVERRAELKDRIDYERSLL